MADRARSASPQSAGPEATTAGTGPEDVALRDLLLAWYDRHRRDLPWRAPPGARPDPYRVLVSEFMLQQTTTATVRPRFAPFLERFPTLEHLAGAEEGEVLHAWQGLGYYRRARALHACARAIVAGLGGRLPDDPDALCRLPGIGRYTADAIAAIAFERPVVPVDGNIRRVVARLHASALEPDRALRRAVDATFAGADRPGDVAQALMDLGATVCTARRPGCLTCPLRGGCRARHSGMVEAYPPAALRRARPRRSGLAFLLQRQDGAVLFRRRPPHGLLGGMHELPSSPWLEAAFDPGEALAHAPAAADWQLHRERVRHVFSHFELELHLATARSTEAAQNEAGDVWCPPDAFGRLALPTVMRKILRLADARETAWPAGELPD